MHSATALIIDGSYLAYKSYHAPYKLTTSTGINSTMIHTFFNTFLSLINKFKPTTTVIAWDTPTSSLNRKQLYDAYKGNRHPPHPNFLSQLEDIKKILYQLNIKQFYSPNNEADDVIASLANIFYLTKPIHRIIIYSADKDLLQLVNDKTSVYDGKTLYTPTTVEKKFGVQPSQIPDLLAITGDNTDNIEGIKGYGYKRAAKLLRSYHNVEAIPNDILPKDITLRNKQLTTLKANCHLKKLSFENFEDIEAILNKYELKQIKKRLSQTFYFKKQII